METERRALRAMMVLVAGFVMAAGLLLTFGGLAGPQPPAVEAPLEHLSSLRVMDIPPARAAAPTEMSYLWTTGGAGDGATTYTRAQWSQIVKITGGCPDGEGVVVNSLNELTATLATNALTLNTGHAVVDGKPYYLSVAGVMTIPSAVGGGNTRIDRVVLRADWTAQTVRARVITGTDAASPSVPSYSSTSESTYDVLLYRVLVNTSGNLTLTDERNWCIDGIISEPITRSLVTGQLDISAGGIGTTELAADSVNDTQIGSRVPMFVARQGGHTTNWATVGTTDYTPGAVIMQGGVRAAGSGTSGNATITFPQAFGGTPIVIPVIMEESFGVACSTNWNAGATTVTQTVVSWACTGASEPTINIAWIAIGRE